MKIVKEGEVLFRNGEVVLISHFTAEECKNGEIDLENYVKKHYTFKKDTKDVKERKMLLTECERLREEVKNLKKEKTRLNNYIKTQIDIYTNNRD